MQNNSGRPQFQPRPGSPPIQFSMPTLIETPLPIVPPPVVKHRVERRGQFVRLPYGRPTAPHSRWRKRLWILLGLLFLLALLAGAIWWNTQAGAAVTLYQVGAQQSAPSVGGGGLVFPYRTLTVSYPVAERVTDVKVKAGDKVSMQQELLQLDPTQLDAQIKQAADNVAAAQVYLNTVTANGNATTIAQAQQQYTLAQNRYNALVAQSSSPLMRNGALISPMNGVVTSVAINAGEVFSADAPLLTIMDESTLVVHLKVPLVDLALVRTGQSAIVSPASSADAELLGSVTSIIPQADPQTATFEVWVSVAHPPDTLLPGMSAFVRIQTDKSALTVPRMAVLDMEHHPVVFVVQQQRAHLRMVQVLGRSGDRLLISEGLQRGDAIVLVGLATLHDGQRIAVRKIEGGARL